MNLISEDYLIHHGIKGMKWGVRHDKPPSAKRIKKLEQKAIKKEYKRSRKNGGGLLLRSVRTSTGENFNKAEQNFRKVVSSDQKYKELSKKAYDAELKRLMFEKEAYNPRTGLYDDDKYEKIINSDEYKKLESESRKATEDKDKRVTQLSKQYIDTIKEAKLNDLNITKNRDIAKKYVSSKFYNYYWDGNLEYGPDNFYEPWVDETTFHKK